MTEATPITLIWLNKHPCKLVHRSQNGRRGPCLHQASKFTTSDQILERHAYESDQHLL